MTEADVIVVGLGASGVAAMRKLHDAGLEVVGLEAADRIGGRIHTVPFGAQNVDLGAAWCMGQKHNVIYDIANPLNLIDTSEPFNRWYLFSNGEELPCENANSIVGAISEELENADKNNTKSISEYLKDIAKSNKKLSKDPKLSKQFIEWFERNIHQGTPTEPCKAMSLRSMDEYWGKWDYVLHWKGRGFQTVLDLLLNKYPDPSKQIKLNIQLKKEVESITWGKKKKEVQVKCKDGSDYTAKSVIITVSLGVLKESHAKLFKPALPIEKVNSINNLHLSFLGKVFLEFEKPWWPKTPAKFNILWREEDKAKFKGEDKWLSEIYGFQTIDCQPNVMMAWICGAGVEMMEKTSEEKVRAGVQKILDILFKKQFGLTPIKDILRTQYALDPLIKCAYAYRSVATEETGGSAIILSEPLYNCEGFPLVCFGGEATSHHRHKSADGAVEAGFREAQRLIECFKKIE